MNTAAECLALTVVTWNVDGWHTIRDEQLDLLDATDADLLFLQEVTPTSLDRLHDRGWHGRAALDLLPEGHTERGTARPRFSCAVLARPGVQLTGHSTIRSAPSQVRTLVAEAAFDGQQVLAVSAALPPGSMWGRPAKVCQADALRDCLRAWPGPALLGMDRNGPKFERWESDQTVWWPEDDPSFFDLDAEHGLRDVLVTYYATHAKAAQTARNERPEGPLAISYIEKRARPPVARRYDLIMATDHWTVEHVNYDHATAIEAGSDHGIIAARLRIP